jgi:hypothetical protein
VVVYSAPEAVMDKIAKMRSLGSLQAWGAITKVISASVFAQLPLCMHPSLCMHPLSLPTTRTPASQTHLHPLPLPLPHTHTCTHAPARTRPCMTTGVRKHKHTFSLTLN